jgi:hypothetical protein
MSDQQHEADGIRQKVSDIVSDSVQKSGEILEAAKQALGGDVKEGLTNILKAASDLATNATEKGIGIAADVIDKLKKPNE